MNFNVLVGQTAFGGFLGRGRQLQQIDVFCFYCALMFNNERVLFGFK
jgi:hypothetical protein